MKVKFFSEKQKANKLSSEIQKKVRNILKTGKYTNADYVKQFEDLYKKYFKTKFCVAVNNGTSALHLALLSLGIKKGDEIIVPSLTFIASVAAVNYVGAKPIFVDINNDDWLINVNNIQKSITKKTKAIIVVHLHGLMCDMDKIKSIAKKNNIKIIEDAAQAHGSSFKKKLPGFYSDVATFSFYPTKNLGAIGEGGAIITNNREIFNKSKRMRTWSHNKYNFYEVSYNYRMSEFSAISLISKIRFLHEDVKKRIMIAEKYKKKLDIKSYSKFDLKNKKHSYHIFAIKVSNKKREKIINYLKLKGIDTNIHYPYSLPKLKFFKIKNRKTHSPMANKVANELLSLPIYPELDDKRINYTIKMLNEFIKLEK